MLDTTVVTSVRERKWKIKTLQVLFNNSSLICISYRNQQISADCTGHEHDISSHSCSISGLCRWKGVGCGESRPFTSESISAAVQAWLEGDYVNKAQGPPSHRIRAEFSMAKSQGTRVSPSPDKADPFQQPLGCKCTWREVEVAWKAGVFPC